MTTGVRRRPRDQAGLTLIEVLVTVAILGIAFVTVVGGMAVSIAGSDLHRKQATSQTVLRNLAEFVKRVPYECSGQYAEVMQTFSDEVTEPVVMPATAAPGSAEATYTIEFVRPDPSSYPAELWEGEAQAQFRSLPSLPPDAVPDDPCEMDTGLQRLTLRVRSVARSDLCSAPLQSPATTGPACEELHVYKRRA